ncbi:fasciclin domain-containing protein [Winogradskyella ursingii]|uniref:fasciclin domain-containing protein n=1 Tax=Winogradskyella ursingii TaxID=2686079 RepID=UPI0015CCD771|nr:fasciclin domain-containing protein [Winogradskyella ursingii]
MKTNMIKTITLALTLFFVGNIGYSQTNMQEPLAGVKNSMQYKTVDLIYMDKDLSTFANLLMLSGLDASLSMTDKSHTLFIPTNEAFREMSIEDFAELTNPTNRAKLVDFVNRHFKGSKIMSNQLTESKVLDAENGDAIEITNYAGQVAVGGARVIAADIETANGIVHVVNDIIKYN